MDDFRTRPRVDLAGLPVVDRLPVQGPQLTGLHAPPDTSDALASYAQAGRAWIDGQVRVSARVSVAFWALIALLAATGTGLMLVARRGPARGPLWDAATLDGHPLVVIGLCGGCLLVLLVLATVTRGLTRPGGRQLVAMTVAGAVGVLTVSGAVLVVLVLVLAALFVTAFAVLVLALVAESAASSRRS